MRKKTRSWEPVKDWYDALVGDKGHYYHQSLIVPTILQKIEAIRPKNMLDVACGQGVLSRHLPSSMEYWGIDHSRSLIRTAVERNRSGNHHFLEKDACSFSLKGKQDFFECATIILALQDIDDMGAALISTEKHLAPGGHLLIVLNHPCYRIPRQSGWLIDEEQKRQSRKVDLYMSSQNIPIQTNPGKGKKSPQVYHHHRPLNAYFSALHQAGFVTENLEEWISDKKSTGPKKKMEDRARKEFPLFLFLHARKDGIFRQWKQ